MRPSDKEIQIVHKDVKANFEKKNQAQEHKGEGNTARLKEISKDKWIDRQTNK